MLKRLVSKLAIWHFPSCWTHHIAQSCEKTMCALSLLHAAPRVCRKRLLIKQKLNFLSCCAQRSVWQKPGTIQYPHDTIPTVQCGVDRGKIVGRIKGGHIDAGIEDKTEFVVVSETSTSGYSWPQDNITPMQGNKGQMLHLFAAISWHYACSVSSFLTTTYCTWCCKPETILKETMTNTVLSQIHCPLGGRLEYAGPQTIVRYPERSSLVTTKG